MQSDGAENSFATHPELAWAILQAMGVFARDRASVHQQGGAVALSRLPPDQLWKWLRAHASGWARSASRKKARPERDDVQSVSDRREQARSRLTGFLKGGGEIFGGVTLSDLGSLQRVLDSKLCLFTLGNASLVRYPFRVAIIGTRQASEAACHRAYNLAGALAKRGVVIVSGGAMGVDLSAHQGALDAGGETIEVVGETMGSRPATNFGRIKGPSERVLKLIVHGPEVAIGRWVFASRNKFIAGAADAVVLVAGKKDSGARYAPARALKLGLPVRVFPGDVEDAHADLANHLLATTAALPFRSVEELLQCVGAGFDRQQESHPELDFCAPGQKAPTQEESGNEESGNEERENEEGGSEEDGNEEGGSPPSSLLHALSAGPITVDEAALLLKCASQEIQLLAIELEMSGRLRRRGGRLELL